MELVYGIKDKPSMGKVFLFAVDHLISPLSKNGRAFVIPGGLGGDFSL